MASLFGWWRFSAIFSGNTCTIQKIAIPTPGITISTNQAMPLATASSVSPVNSEAWADGIANIASKDAPMPALLRMPRVLQRFIAISESIARFIQILPVQHRYHGKRRYGVPSVAFINHQDA